MVTHDAIYPNPADVSDCRTYTRDFLVNLLATVWAVSFERFSLTDVIKDATVKQYMVDAEAALRSGSLEEAVKQAVAALDWALTLVRRSVVGREPGMGKKAFVVSDGWGRGATKEDEDIFRAFKRMQDTLLYVALGMDYSEYMAYRAVAGETIFSMGGDFRNHGMKTPLTEEEGEFVVGYSTAAVSQIEARVGSLEKPFGREHWY